MKRRILSIITALSLCLSLCPTWAFAVEGEPGLCAHHPSHTEDCGYIAPTEGQPCGHEHTDECCITDVDGGEVLNCQHFHDGECGYVQADPGAPCGYECRICPIEDLIAALPSRVTEDNAEEVREQLDKILDLYRELTGEEQEQLDISHCLELQAELDAANKPMPLADGEAGNVTLAGQNQSVIFTETVCLEGCKGHTITQQGTVIRPTILVESGTHDITFQGLNLTFANVGVMPGAAMNLTISGTNKIAADNSRAGIYVPVGATLVITEQNTGSLEVSGSGYGAGIGGADIDISDLTGDRAGDPNCGTVIINGGTINATGGGGGAAGIGGGCTDDVPGNGGDITINGGTVTATGGSDGDYGGAGIGGGSAENPNDNAGSGGRLTINGGTVNLIAGSSTSFGFGKGTGANPSGPCSLTWADTSYLNPSTTLDPSGDYTVNTDPTADMIVVPTNLVYNGQVQTPDIRLDTSVATTRRLFGQDFTVNASAEGWTYTIDPAEVKEAGDYTVTFSKEGHSAIGKTFTVAACPHTGTTFTPAADGKHTGECSICGQRVEAEHTWDNGACTDCNATAAAMSVNGSATTYYTASDFASAFAAENDGATVTLLGDVELANEIVIKSGTFTLDLNGQTITNNNSIAIRVNGGAELTIRDSMGNGKIISSNKHTVAATGTLTLEGGTFTSGNASYHGVYVNSGDAVLSVTGDKVSIQNTAGGYGLGVNNAKSVTLTAGTYGGIKIWNSMTLADLLGAGCAYYSGGTPSGIPIKRDDLPVYDDALYATVLPGPVTVGECSHKGGLQPTGSGYQHGGDCPYCGAALTAENHSAPNGSGECDGCGAEIVAEVAANNSTTYYTNIVPAFATENSGSKVTLLRDVDLGASYLSIPSGEPNTETTFTLDCGAYTLSSSNEHSAVYLHRSSSLTFVGGTIKNTGSGSALACDMNSKAFTMTGGVLDTTGNNSDAAIHDNGINTIIRITGGTVGVNGSGLNISNYSSLTVDSTRVQLSGGTYGTIYNNNKNIPLSTLLADGCAARGPAGLIRCDTDTDTLPGPITVEKCDHPGVTVADNGNGTHGMNCPYCGYNYSHTTTLTATANGYTVTLTGGCNEAGCGYTAELGKAAFTFENLVYGNPEAKVSWTKDGSEMLSVMVKIGDQVMAQGDDAEVSLTLKQLFGNTKLTAGKHTLNIFFCDNSARGAVSNACELTFTIAPAPLTDGMVTLDQSEVPYNGTEQKPNVTVKQGETTLTAGTDYGVSYTRDGKPTTDFTNAGTVTITITGKGNYKNDTVTRTYTITPATPTIAWSSGTQALTYTGQQANVKPTVTLVGNDSFDGTIIYSYGAYTGPDLPVNAGTYTIKASIAAEGNYASANSTNELTLTINKAQAAVTVNPTANTLTYDGIAQALVAAGTASVGEVVYSLTETGTYSTTIPTGTNAGSYTVWYRIADTDNYNGTDPVKVAVTIGKATAPAPQTGTLNVQNGQNRDYTYNLSRLLPVLASGQSFGGDVTYTLKSVNITKAGYYENGTAVISGTTLTLPIKAVTSSDKGQIGTITVTISSKNFADVEATINVNRVNKQPVSIEGVTAQNGTYNGKSHSGYTGTPTASPYSGGFTVTYAKADGTALSGAPTNAGDYTVTITLNENNDYTGSRTLSFTISKASITIKADDKRADVGTVKPALTYTVTGLVSGDTLAIAPTLACDADMNTIGQYPITASGAAVPSGGNYNTAITYVAGTLNVTVKTNGGGYVPPSGPSTPGSSTITVPVSGEQSTVHVSASVSGTTATVSKIDTTQIENVIGDNGQASMVEIDFTGLGKTIDTVKLPAAAIKDIAAKAQNEEVRGLTVKLPDGEISFDAKALSAIQAQASNQITLTVTPAKPNHLNSRQKEVVGSAPVFDLTLRSSSGAITDFRGGYATVSLPYTLTAGQNPSGVVVYYLDSTGNITPCTTMYDVRSKLAIFTTGHFSLYFVGYDPAAVWVNPFSDVAESAWYYDAVRYASENGLMGGYDNGKFSPNNNLSRAQFAQILFNKEGRPVVNYLLRYNDVADGAWYTEAVRWATSQGVVNGYGNGMFGPNDNITREQLAVMLWRYAGSPAATNKELHFTDSDEASGYALEALRWAAENGVLNGCGDGRLNPKGLAARAQVAQMLKNFLENQ